MKKYILSLIIGVILLLTGFLLLFVWKEEANKTLVIATGFVIVFSVSYKFYKSFGKIDNKLLRYFTIGELIALVTLGILTILKADDSSGFIKWSIGLSFYISGLLFLWQNNYQKKPVKNILFFTNIALITIGSAIFLSDFDENKLRKNIVIVLLSIGAVLTIFSVTKLIIKKKRSKNRKKA